MSNKKSIIGEQYNASDLLSYDIETGSRTRLGNRIYTIIKDPYMSEQILGPKRLSVFVNVLDSKTGRAYKVVYEPARIIENRNPEQQPEAAKRDNEFIDRVNEIARELKSIFEESGIAEKCGVVFMASSDNGNGTCKAVSLIAGKQGNIANCISAACDKDDRVLEIMKHGTMMSVFGRVFGSNNKKK